jgi:hypothetical protein
MTIEFISYMITIELHQKHQVFYKIISLIYITIETQMIIIFSHSHGGSSGHCLCLLQRGM